MTPNSNFDDSVVTLRCSKCGKPITPAEAVQTPTGYRCRDCVRRQQKVFETTRPLDYVWGFLIALVISLAGSFLTRAIGFFTFLLAPAAGVAAAEAVRAATGKRRGKGFFGWFNAGMIVGGLPLILVEAFALVLRIRMGSLGLFSLLPLAYQALYLVLAAPSAYYRLSGLRRL